MNHSARLTEQGKLLRLHGIAPYLRAFRPEIPEQVVDVLVAATTVRGGDTESLLDLGSGTGLMVRALHPHFRDIIAVDPVDELLDQAEQDLRPRLAPGTTLRLVQSEAEQFTPPPGWTASLATVCRAFHWMDHPVVLDRLARVVPASGVVAIVGDSGFWGVDNPWKLAVRAVVRDFLGAEGRPGRETFPHRDELFGEILGASPFNEVEKVVVPIRRMWSSESILGFLYSNAFSARTVFGDRVDEFEDEVRRVLADYSAADSYPEDDEFIIWLARKGKVNGGSSHE